MIWAWVLVIWQLGWTPPGLSQDLYHIASPIKISPSAEPEDAYFGYSVAYERQGKRLLVSAPKHDRIGQVYSCDINTQHCTGVTRDKSLEKFDSTRDHNYWFGAVVKAGPSFFVTCAPMYLENRPFTWPDKSTKNDAGTYGRCYKYTDSDTFAHLDSISNNDRNSTPDSTLLDHYMDSFGWSIDIADDNILIGGPAMYTGRVIVNVSPSIPPTFETGYTRPRTSQETANRIVEYNFGYSIVSGYFDKKHTTNQMYAIGSPYGEKGRGKTLRSIDNSNAQVIELETIERTFPREIRHRSIAARCLAAAIRHDVLLYWFNSINSRLSYLNRNGIVTSGDKSAVGSMFGAVLCAARLTPHSKATTLIVGAPTYADLDDSYNYNQGAVYFYEPAEKLPIANYFRKIVGEGNDDYFGSAIISIGDLNGDGMDELAIAAPYANSGIGAVYLYSSKDLADKGKMFAKYIQKITPEQTSSLTSFGLSLSTIQDYDDNGCNELAIGAPQNNTVMVLKCTAFVTVILKENIPDLTLYKDKINKYRTVDNFAFESCLEVQFPEKPDAINTNIKVAIVIYHRDQKLSTTLPNNEYFKTLEKRQNTYCQSITVLTPLNSNYEYPINYEIKASLSTPKPTVFDPSYVALSDLSKLTSKNAIWMPECANASNCMPNITLSSYNLSVALPYLIGSSDSIALNLSVSNKGEVAFSACVRVFLEGTDVAFVPNGCEHLKEESAALVCTPSMPLRDQQATWNLPQILLQTNHLTSETKHIEVRLGIYNHCNQSEALWHNNTIPLLKDHLVQIKGITDSGLDNVTMTKDDVDGKTFEHSYTISNVGVTNWVNVNIILVRQKRPYIEYYPIIIYPSRQSGEDEECKLLNEKTDEQSETLTCTIDQLYKEPVKVTVPMLIKYGTLENAINDNLNTQYTSLTLDLDGEKKDASVTSTLLYGKKLAIWIIVVASIVGLLILVIICYLLSKCGFFNRKEKKNLADARLSVKRQTMIRRTMTEGVRLPLPTDRQSLIADVPELTAEEAAANDHRLRLDSNATRRN